MKVMTDPAFFLGIFKCKNAVEYQKGAIQTSDDYSTFTYGLHTFLLRPGIPIYVYSSTVEPENIITFLIDGLVGSRILRVGQSFFCLLADNLFLGQMFLQLTNFKRILNATYA